MMLRDLINNIASAIILAFVLVIFVRGIYEDLTVGRRERKKQRAILNGDKNGRI